MRHHRFARWIAVLAWAALLLLLGTREGNPAPEAGFWATPGLDKVAHGLLYAVLGLLVQGAWAARTLPAACLAGCVAAVAIGGLDEWLQSMTPGRHPDLGDLVADAVGGALGGVAGRFFRTGRPRNRSDV